MHLFIDALWSPAGKGLTSWLLFVVYNCEFVTFPLVSWSGVELDVSIPDLCTLAYFYKKHFVYVLYNILVFCVPFGNIL